MKKLNFILADLAIKSGLVRIALHALAYLLGKESAERAIKGMKREFQLNRIIR